MKVDLQREARRGREALEDLTLFEEHVRARQQELFERFVRVHDEGEIYVIREEARALERLINWYSELTETGQLAEQQLGDERYE